MINPNERASPTLSAFAIGTNPILRPGDRRNLGGYEINLVFAVTGNLRKLRLKLQVRNSSAGYLTVLDSTVFGTKLWKG